MPAIWQPSTTPMYAQAPDSLISMPGMVPGPWALGTQQETTHTLSLLLWGLQCSVSHPGNWMFNLGSVSSVRKAGMGRGGEVIGARTW